MLKKEKKNLSIYWTILWILILFLIFLNLGGNNSTEYTWSIMLPEQKSDLELIQEFNTITKSWTIEDCKKYNEKWELCKKNFLLEKSNSSSDKSLCGWNESCELNFIYAEIVKEKDIKICNSKGLSNESKLNCWKFYLVNNPREYKCEEINSILWFEGKKFLEYCWKYQGMLN